MLFTSPIGCLTTHFSCTAGKEQNAPRPFGVKSTWKPVAHSQVGPGASCHGHQQGTSSFPEKTGLRLKRSFQICECETRRRKPALASFSALHPHCSVSHFLGAGVVCIQEEDGCGVLSL